MLRQLTLGFGNIRETDEPATPRDSTSSPQRVRDQDVEQLAQSLRPRVLDCLREASCEVGIHELRSALGFPGECLDGSPQGNPVNRILKQMRAAGEVVCREFDRGEPLFSLVRQGRSGHRPEVRRELSLGCPPPAPVGRSNRDGSRCRWNSVSRWREGGDARRDADRNSASGEDETE